MDNVITFERVAKRLKIPVSTFSTYLEADLVDALGPWTRPTIDSRVDCGASGFAFKEDRAKG